MRRLKIEHLTSYRYDTPVQFEPHRLLLRAREGHDMRIESSRLEITPAHTILWHRDVYGNSVATVTFSELAAELSVRSELILEHYEDLPLEFAPERYAEVFPFQYDAAERPDLVPYQQPLFAKEDLAVRGWASEFWSPGQMLPTFALLDQVNRTIPQRLGYRMREEPGVQRPSETLSLGTGSCRDFATLFTETCRHLGLAARFVSGYLHTPETEAGHGSTHAWSEVYLPGAGWRGFDSTTGGMVGGEHIAVAVSRHPEAIPPVSGAYVGTTAQPPVMVVEVRVSQIG